MRMRSLPLFTAICVLCLVTQAGCTDDEQNPFKKAAIGDWGTYKSTTDVGTFKFEVTAKSTVIAKNDKEVTVKSVTTINGKESPGSETKYDFTKPLDFVKAANLQMKDLTELKKVDDGKETITIGVTKYACKWQSFKMIFKLPALKDAPEGQLKVWICPDAPLGGLVKMEGSTKGSKTTIVLEDSGKSK